MGSRPRRARWRLLTGPTPTRHRFVRPTRYLAASGLFVLASCQSGPGPAIPPVADAPPSLPPVATVPTATPDGAVRLDPDREGRSFTILAVNDVYRISGLLPSERGGLPRLRTLRTALERQQDVLFLHGGDALFPSLLSREYDGAHMIDVLNVLDGDDGAFDPHMVAVFGNHEFDEDGDSDAELFEARMLESDFVWLGANVTFPEQTRGGEDGVDLSKLTDVVMGELLVERGGVRIGIFGLTMGKANVAYAEFAASDAEVLAAADSLTASLAAQGAEFIIGLTHFPLRTDSLLAANADPRLSLIIGGHEHHQIERNVGGRLILKADADATTATVVDVTVTDGQAAIAHTFETLAAGTYRPDPMVQARTEAWQNRFERTFCRDRRQGRYCLDTVIGVVGADSAIAEETAIRAYDSNVGRTYLSLMLEAGEGFRSADPELSNDVPMVALLNSGALRLNQTLLPGDRWLLRHTEELIQYPEDLWILGFTPEELQAALDHSVDQRGEGPWLQVAGMTFTADVANRVATDIHIGGVPLQQVGDSILVVTGDFLAGLVGGGGRDGFAFRDDQNLKRVVGPDGRGIQAKDLFVAWMEAQNGALDFMADRRITIVEPR